MKEFVVRYLAMKVVSKHLISSKSYILEMVKDDLAKCKATFLLNCVKYANIHLRRRSGLVRLFY